MSQQYHSELCNVAYSDRLSMYNDIVTYVDESAKEALGEKITNKVNEKNYSLN